MRHPDIPALTAPDGDVGSSRPLLLVEHAAVWVVHRPWLAVVAIAVLAVSIAARIASQGGGIGITPTTPNS